MTPPLKKRNIFLYAIEPWGNMWYSKHHYAATLAKEHNVYFISLPERWRLRDLFSFKVKTRNNELGINVVEYRNNLPMRFLPNWLTDLVAKFNAFKLKKIVPEGEVLHWCFHPTRVLDSSTLRTKSSKVIYHVVDPYQSLRNDSAFARKADLVVAINPWYLNHYKKLNPKCILVPHGVRQEDRKHKVEVKPAGRQWGKYAILATGVSRFVNYTLLQKCAEHYPELNFLIIGQMFDLAPKESTIRGRLFELPNVHYLGVKQPSELKEFVNSASVGLLTYSIEPTSDVPLSAGRTPLKVITYLAQHCPVVSTNNSYIPELENKGHFKADSENHFVQLVGEVLNGKLSIDVGEVEKYLDSVDYDRLIHRIESELYYNANGSLKENTDNVDPNPKDQNKKLKVPQHSSIVIISNEGWEGPHYSKHRYAIALNELRMIYFIDPPDNWRLSHLFKPAIRKTVSKEGINILSYHNMIPLLGGILTPFNDRNILNRLDRYLKSEGERDPIFWSFDPGRLAYPKALDPFISIYHCADDYGSRWEGVRRLSKNCDHVFCIAYELMERFKNYNSSVHHVPHGLAPKDMDRHVKNAAITIPSPGYGLYIGNINDRHDFSLWAKLFTEHKDVTWLVIGPVNVSDPIGLEIINGKFKNVILHPLVPYDDLKNIIANAGFGFLYLRPEHPANRISSQKVIQFLALGKPFFCSWFSEYANNKVLIHMTDSHEDAMNDFANWRRSGDGPDSEMLRLKFARTQLFTNILQNLPFRF